jgi:hypothetical protein
MSDLPLERRVQRLTDKPARVQRVIDNGSEDQ